MLRLAPLALISAAAGSAAVSLEGRVWDLSGDERRPLAKALVTINQEGRGPGPSMARTDVDGRWRIAGPLDGRYHVGVERPGYYVVTADGTTSSSVLVDCTDSCGPVEFELARGGVVTGIVEDDQGEPLHNARVSLRLDGGAGGREPQDSRSFGSFGRGRWPGGPQGPGPFRGGPRFDSGDRTDDFGRFRVAGLRPGRYEVIAETDAPPDRPRYEQFQPATVEINARQETEVRIVLRREAPAGLKVSGIVTGVDLSPEGRHMLHVHAVAGRSWPPWRFGPPLWALQDGGKFELTGLTPGKYYFAYSRSADGSPGKQIPLGSHELRGNLSGLTLSPVAGLEISGRFELDAEGEVRSADAVLIPHDGGPPAPLYAADPDRTFHQGGVYPGRYRLSARSRNWFLAGAELGGEPVNPGDLSIASNIDSLVIRLSDRFARIEGRIRASQTSDAAPRFLVTLSHGDEEEVRPTDQNGGFLFDRLVPGDYSICARPSDAPRDSPCALERSFPVEAGAQIELALTLPR